MRETVTVLISAKRIPEYARVHKPHGDKLYTLQRVLRIHLEDGVTGVPRLVTAENTVFLVSENSIAALPEDATLAVDFEDFEDAAGFLAEFAGER